MGKIVKLLDENQTEDYFPVSVSEAIFHKDKDGNEALLSDVLKDYSKKITVDEVEDILSAYTYSKEYIDVNIPLYSAELNGEVEY